MTTGNIAGHLFYMALPLMFGNIFQQMYTLCDAVIVGRGCGVNALAAVGAADWINWLIFGIISGFAQGFSIVFAQKFGAGDMKELRKSVGNGVVTAAVLGVIITIISMSLAKPVLIWMDTPKLILGDALSYLYIFYGGSLIVMAYNFASSLLRSLGDGKTPLIAMIIASVINIGLDLLFVLEFNMGVKGAAFATILAQLFSFVYCLIRILRIRELKFTRDDFRIEKRRVGAMLKIGAPVAAQNGIIGVGGIVVQTVINGFGVTFVAGITSTNKLYGILEVAAVSLGYAISTFMGQNLGAGKIDRIKKGMKVGAIMSAVVSVVISFIVIVFGRNILGMFVSSAEANRAEVLNIAYNFLAVMGWTLVILYLLHAYRSALQGLGDTVFAMCSGFAELVMRIACVLILPKFIGIWGVYWAEVAAWTGADLILLSSYYYKINKLSKKGL